ncbi:MAG: ACT domain-containing protein [Candidatus Heteroscillospira sp.]
MSDNKKVKYYLVEREMLPEIFIKVTEARALLETGECTTVAEAASRVGISRSAFYKYKDSIAPFTDMKHGQIITFHVMLRDKMGVLSGLLAIFAESGANILTINQSIPINSTAAVTITAETAEMSMGLEELKDGIEHLDGVIKVEILAG